MGHKQVNERRTIMQSNLTTTGIPMVTAITANALNAAMRQHFYYNTETYAMFVLCVYDDNDEAHYFYLTKHTTKEELNNMPEIFPESIRKKGEKLYTEIEALHIETVPSVKSKRNENHIQIIKDAYKIYKVKTAIILESGIPYKLGTADFQKYTPIVLEKSTDPKNSRALYTQMFKECNIYVFASIEDRVLCTVKRQSEEKEPWGYAFDVKLCYHNTDYNEITPEEKAIIKERFCISTDQQAADMFEITTLAVDLNTLVAKNLPKIEGLSEETYPQIAGAIKDYIRSTQAASLKLCHTIKPSQKNQYNYLFRPKNYIFTVSGHSSNDPGLFTLNYLTSFDDHLPPVKDIGWDWLTQSEANQGAGGIMAIHRDVFFEKFNTYFKKNILFYLRKKVIASMESHTCSFSYCYEYSQDHSEDSSTFTYDPEEKNYIWSGYSHKSSSETASCWIPPFFAATGQLKFQYTVSCSASAGNATIDNIVYPAIIYNVHVILFADVIYDSGHSKGNIFDQTLTAALGFGIDQYGKVLLKKTASIKDNGTTMDKSIWSEFASFGAIDECITGISDCCKSWVSDSVKKIKTSFLNNFLCYSNWIMPGSKTFTFKNESFSSDQDFCSEITYTNS